MTILISAILCFLLQSSLLSWTVRLYQSSGWSGSPGLLLADRLVYALLMPGLGLLLLFYLAPRLLSISVGSPRFPLFREGTNRLAGLVWALIGALLLFGMVYLVSELLQPSRQSAGLAAEIRRSPALGLFLVTTGLLTPVLEELYYRGILQQYLGRSSDKGGGLRGALVSILVQAICFSLVHARNGPGPALMLFVGGLGLGILYWRYGLASSILAHSSYNLAILLQFQASTG